jgi:hypothetical protein
MLNLLKWNFMDFFHRNLWMFIVAAASLMLMAIVPNTDGFTNGLLVFSSLVLGGIFFPACIVLAMYQCFSWLRHDSALLELSLPVPAWKQMLSRVTIAVLVNLLACLGMLLLMIFFYKNTSGKWDTLTVEHWQSLGSFVLFLLLGDMTVLISYMISRSIGLTRLWSALITTLLTTFLMIGIFLFTVQVMVWANVLSLPTFSGEHILTMNGNLNITSFLPAIITALWIVVLEYLGSSLLLKYAIHVD